MKPTWNIVFQGTGLVLLSAILVVLLIGTSYAQIAATPTAVPPTTEALPTAAPTQPERTLLVIGEGRVVAKPDLARIELGVETLEPTIAEAVARNEETLATLMISLSEYIAAEDMRTTSYNVYPERNYEPGVLAPVLGYHVTNMLQITVRELDKIGEVLETAIDAGANQIYGISFELDPSMQAQLESSARAQATLNMYNHAEELAALNHAALGSLISVSEVVGSSDYLSYPYAGGAGGPGITPGGLSVIVRLQGTFALSDDV